ncbi:DUF2938 family protein [Methyloligella sp. GL2]|nr:DUF2938 family protein [Methyloligella sp. GL2]
MLSQLIEFTLIVGIGSTIALDLWALLLDKFAGFPGTHWGMVGRWLLGIPHGNLVLDTDNETPASMEEWTIGWIFHYLVGLAYAAMLPLFWGIGYIAAPTVFPVFMIGVVVSSLAGLMILMPGLGGGLFARKTPNPALMIAYVIVAHSVFALAQFLLALGVSGN